MEARGTFLKSTRAALAEAGARYIVARARLTAKVMTFVADALDAAVTSLGTPAANDPVDAPAAAASDKPAPSATEMEEAPASVVPIFGGG